MTGAPEQVKHAVDVISISSVAAAWLGVFSTVVTIIATTLAAVWSAIRIYETDTVQRWLKRR